MKKLILFAAILFAGVSVVKAEDPIETKQNQSVLLTVNLSAVQHIDVSGPIVIDYSSANDYANGKVSNSKTTVKVTSSGSYAIRVTADELKGPEGATAIDASTIAVSVEGLVGDFAKDDDDFRINATEPLISNKKGGSNVVYQVSYKGMGADKYYTNYNSLENAEKGIQEYSTQVLYSIEAK